MKILYVMRGVPGVGKSHKASRLAPAENIFSTDEWFDRQKGGYRASWSASKLGIAHNWNQERVAEALANGVTPVVVDNTNLTLSAVKPYVAMARKHGYAVEIHEADSTWWLEIKELLKDLEANSALLREWAGKLAGKTVHGVPEATIHKMLLTYTPYEV